MNSDKFFRRLDGTYNNLKHPTWGAKDTPLLRKTPVAYADGYSSLAKRGVNSPNPREISNLLCHQDIPTENSADLSDFVWVWGQFLDHEIDLTEAAEPSENADIPIPEDEPYHTGASMIPFKRSAYAFTTGLAKNNPRQQINQLASYIDAANVYGVDSDRLFELRAGDGSGKMKVFHSRKGDLLPFNTTDLANATPASATEASRFFLAGDVRANEHAILTAMHTLFVREHNRLCDRVIEKHPILLGKDEEIFQLARKLVGAIMQAITYKEFIPALLGDNALSHYDGYCEDVNAGVANVFSTACYRLGHSMLPDQLHSATGKTHIKLRDAFFNPDLIKERGIEFLLQGRYKQKMQEIDLQISSEVRNFLFSPPNDENQPFLDLASLNIQRGRDHGLADYNSVRESYGLPRVTGFDEITCKPKVQKNLKILYGDVNTIDPWIGGLAEDHKEGAQVGELIFTVLKDQFERMRDGDRFWYENDPILQGYQDKIESVTLAKVIRRNTYLKDVPDNVFRVKQIMA